jgi:hypothetical protein
LHKRFFQAAEIDLQAARILTKTDLSQPALYHFQQAFEKCIKSYYSLKESVDNNTSESIIYKKLIKLGHDTQKSTIKLLYDIVDIQKVGAEKKLYEIYKIQSQNQSHSAINPRAVRLILQHLSMIMGLHMSLDFLVARLHLEKNYVGNVKDYARTVKHFYDTNQISNVQIIIPEPDQILLLIISATTTLYPCFYNMEEITRYPLKEFSYKNLDLLANQRQACVFMICWIISLGY